MLLHESPQPGHRVGWSTIICRLMINPTWKKSSWPQIIQLQVNPSFSESLPFQEAIKHMDASPSSELIQMALVLESSPFHNSKLIWGQWTRWCMFNTSSGLCLSTKGTMSSDARCCLPTWMKGLLPGSNNCYLAASHPLWICSNSSNKLIPSKSKIRRRLIVSLRSLKAQGVSKEICISIRGGA